MKVDEAQLQFLKTYSIDYIVYEEKGTEESTALSKITLFILHKAKTWSFVTKSYALFIIQRYH